MDTAAHHRFNTIIAHWHTETWVMNEIFGRLGWAITFLTCTPHRFNTIIANFCAETRLINEVLTFR